MIVVAPGRGVAGMVHWCEDFAAARFFRRTYHRGGERLDEMEDPVETLSWEELDRANRGIPVAATTLPASPLQTVQVWYGREESGRIAALAIQLAVVETTQGPMQSVIISRVREDADGKTRVSATQVTATTVETAQRDMEHQIKSLEEAGFKPAAPPDTYEPEPWGEEKKPALFIPPAGFTLPNRKR